MKLHASLPIKLQRAAYVDPKEAPFANKTGKATGSRRQGLVYERRVCEALAGDLQGQLVRGPWISYSKGASERKFFCQPDALIHVDNRTYVIEAKLSIRPRLAQQKLKLLYGPLISMLHPEAEIILLQVCKHLRRGAKPRHLIKVADLDILNHGEYAVIHYPNP